MPDASRVVSKICARARCEPMTMRPSGAEWIPRPFPRSARSVRAILASNAFDGRPRAVSLSCALTHARHCRSTRARERRSTRERRSSRPAALRPSLSRQKSRTSVRARRGGEGSRGWYVNPNNHDTIRMSSNTEKGKVTDKKCTRRGRVRPGASARVRLIDFRKRVAVGKAPRSTERR